jgi:hypothetical protein
LLDFSHPFQGDSMVASIGIELHFALFNSFDFRMSKKIEEKMNDNL